MNFRLLIDYEVIEFIEALPRKDRLLLRNRFVAIQDFPGRYSDYTESDSTGRRVTSTSVVNTRSSFGRIMPINI